MSEIDISFSIIAKSDQINADDLLGGPMVITITKVSADKSKDQPVSIGYAEDSTKVWRPCKSMRRVLVAMWGSDAAKWKGERVELYRDPDAEWAGKKVGGVRISRASITKPLSVSIAIKRGAKSEWTVGVLPAVAPVATKAERAAEKLRGMGRLDEMVETFGPVSGWSDETLSDIRDALEGR